MSKSPDKVEWGWTASQRRAILILLFALLAVLCFRYFTQPGFVPNPQPAEGARAGELATRIDPNTADWQTLAAIPTLGEKRAKDIVAYRQQMQSVLKTLTVFKRPLDLIPVRGIGVATIENIQPYLTFPGDPSTQPKP
jgi:hypothetical protein